MGKDSISKKIKIGVEIYTKVYLATKGIPFFSTKSILSFILSFPGPNKKNSGYTKALMIILKLTKTSNQIVI